MTHGSLFSGIGGFDLAAEWMGWENVFHCDNNKFCQKILKQHWPEAILYEDIKTTEFIQHRGQIDILTGGFPCQPFSQAGDRQGTNDNRYLWPEMLRAIREIRPAWAVGENVRGIINWNEGLVFDKVQTDLETEGYEIIPIILPAAALNAPHSRERVWFIAHANFGGYRNLEGPGRKEDGLQEFGWEALHTRMPDGADRRNVANPDSHQRLERWLHETRPKTSERYAGARYACENEWNSWQDFPTQPPLRGRNDGLPDRVDRIKALGNAVVPQIVFQLFKAIEQYENNPPQIKQ